MSLLENKAKIEENIKNIANNISVREAEVLDYVRNKMVTNPEPSALPDGWDGWLLTRLSGIDRAKTLLIEEKKRLLNIEKSIEKEEKIKEDKRIEAEKETKRLAKEAEKLAKEKYEREKIEKEKQEKQKILENEQVKAQEIRSLNNKIDRLIREKNIILKRVETLTSKLSYDKISSSSSKKIQQLIDIESDKIIKNLDPEIEKIKGQINEVQTRT